MTESTTCITHHGAWDASTRAIPALAFIEKYSNQVDSLDISGPFHSWYSPSCDFYNANGIVYHGGGEIWTWMKNLFAPFSALHHDIGVVRLIKADAAESSPERSASWVMIETNTEFSIKDPRLAGDPIVVPRFLSFLVGKSGTNGQGTDGLQILEARVWWDSAVLGRELAARQERLLVD